MQVNDDEVMADNNLPDNDTPEINLVDVLMPESENPEVILNSSIVADTNEDTAKESSKISQIVSKDPCSESYASFFEKRTITSVKKPKRKFQPPFLAGSLNKKCNVKIMESIGTKASGNCDINKQTVDKSKKEMRITTKANKRTRNLKRKLNLRKESRQNPVLLA